jgi:hypothetical protein
MRYAIYLAGWWGGGGACLYSQLIDDNELS